MFQKYLEKTCMISESVCKANAPIEITPCALFWLPTPLACILACFCFPKKDILGDFLGGYLRPSKNFPCGALLQKLGKFLPKVPQGDTFGRFWGVCFALGRISVTQTSPLHRRGWCPPSPTPSWQLPNWQPIQGDRESPQLYFRSPCDFL